MRPLIGLLIISLLGSITAIPAILPQTYAQVSVGASQQNIEVVGSERVRAQIFSFIGATRLINYTLFENGDAIYTFEFVGLPQFLYGNSTSGNPVASNIIEVYATHGFTPENGYTFDAASGTILTPEGKRLVIETFEPSTLAP